MDILFCFRYCESVQIQIPTSTKRIRGRNGVFDRAQISSLGFGGKIRNLKSAQCHCQKDLMSYHKKISERSQRGSSSRLIRTDQYNCRAEERWCWTQCGHYRDCRLESSFLFVPERIFFPQTPIASPSTSATSSLPIVSSFASFATSGKNLTNLFYLQFAKLHQRKWPSLRMSYSPSSRKCIPCGGSRYPMIQNTRLENDPCLMQTHEIVITTNNFVIRRKISVASAICMMDKRR